MDLLVLLFCTIHGVQAEVRLREMSIVTAADCACGTQLH